MVTSRMLHLTSRYQLAVLAVMSIGSLFIDRELATGLLAGGTVMGANFWLMRYLLFKAVGGAKPSGAYALLLGLKFGIMLAALWVLVGVLELHPMGISLGMVTLFIGIGLGLMHSLLQPEQTT